MPKQAIVNVPAATWTELTDSDVTAITFQNRSNGYVDVVGTDGTTPTSANGVRYDSGQGEQNTALSDIFPGVSATRVFAYSPVFVQVFVSHA